MATELVGEAAAEGKAETDAGGVVHGLPHVIDEFVDAAVDGTDTPGLFAKNRVAGATNRDDCHRGAPEVAWAEGHLVTEG